MQTLFLGYHLPPDSHWATFHLPTLQLLNSISLIKGSDCSYHTQCLAEVITSVTKKYVENNKFI